MSRAQPTVLQALKQHLPRNTSLLLAISGGQDSVALLHGARSLAAALSLKMAVVHVDHGLRAESGADAEFVRRLADDYQLPFFLRKAGQIPDRLNLEEWGRKLRYGFLRELMAEEGYQYSVTAHTANDVAETLLMRLVSNKELNTISRFDERRRLIRPLLDVSREEIAAYIKERGLEFVEDQTNSDTSFLRNRIRHVLIPLLEKEFDPRMVEVLANRAAAIAEDNVCLNAMVDKLVAAAENFAFGSKNWLRHIRTSMGSLPAALRWRFAERLFRKRLCFNLGRKKAVELVLFLEGRYIGMQLPGGISLRAYRGGIRVLEAKEEKVELE